MINEMLPAYIFECLAVLLWVYGISSIQTLQVDETFTYLQVYKEHACKAQLEIVRRDEKIKELEQTISGIFSMTGLICS